MTTDCNWDFLNRYHSVPEGLVVKRGPSGYYGIYATKAFPKGSIIYRGRQITIPNILKDYEVMLEHADGTKLVLPSNTYTHTVQFSESERWLYLFDGFTNHSCDPTTTCQSLSDEEYDTIALRDIKIGDEITSDYNLFEYDCRDKNIDECLCGSLNCVGRVAGFRHLSLDQQRQRIHLVDETVLKAMSSDDQNKFLFFKDSMCPVDRVLLCTETSNYQESTYGAEPTDIRRKLVAARDFHEGEIIYSNESVLFPQDWSIVVQNDVFGWTI